jgi:hypothetical protein
MITDYVDHKQQGVRMNLQQSSTTVYRTAPSPFKRKFQELGVRAGAVAVYIQRSYPQTLNYLNGVAPVPAKIEQKMQDLIEEIQGQGA